MLASTDGLPVITMAIVSALLVRQASSSFMPGTSDMYWSINTMSYTRRLSRSWASSPLLQTSTL